MGLFKKETSFKKEKEKVSELCGGLIQNKHFENLLIQNNLDHNSSNKFYKDILLNEIEDGYLLYDDIEDRLNELFKLDVKTLNLKIRISKKLNTNLFHTQEDINKEMGKEYIMKLNKKLKKKYDKDEKKNKSL